MVAEPLGTQAHQPEDLGDVLALRPHLVTRIEDEGRGLGQTARRLEVLLQELLPELHPDLIGGVRGDFARIDGVHIAPRGEDLQLAAARAASLGGRDEAPAHAEGAVVELLSDAAETRVDLVQRQL